MPFYYVQDVYHKNQLGTLEQRQMIPGANIISGKAILAKVNRAGRPEPSAVDLGGEVP